VARLRSPEVGRADLDVLFLTTLFRYVLPVHLIVYRHGHNLKSSPYYRIVNLNRINRTYNNVLAYIGLLPATTISISFTINTLQPVYPDLDPLNSNSMPPRFTL
jgi:hypothetical protein